MQNPTTFKEFPNQSHIELKFSGRDQHQLEREEALQKYRKNINLLTKIFTFEVDKDEMAVEQQKQALNKDCLAIDPNLLANLNESLSKLKERHASQLEEFKKKNELFAMRLKEYWQAYSRELKVNTQDEFNELLNQLQQEDLLTDQHPFLDPRSNFYQKTNLQQPVQLSYDQCQDMRAQMRDEASIVLN